MASESRKVIALAIMIDVEPTLTPYSSHKNVPNVNTTTIAHDRSRADRVDQIFQTCGTNDAVVRVPAIRPRVS